MTMGGIIYKITNKINGKVYIGQTIRTVEERWKAHYYECVNQKLNTRLGRAIRKYGFVNFRIEVIEKTDDLDKREIFYISKYRSCGKNGYNIKIGGSGGPHAQSTKNKIAKSNKKRVRTDEMRTHMSLAIKKWHKERGYVPRSEEFKKKISLANGKRKMPHNVKIIFQEYNEKNRKPIICIDSNVEYSSITEACKALNLNAGHINMHLRGKCSHVKGLRFRLKA